MMNLVFKMMILYPKKGEKEGKEREGVQVISTEN